MSSEMSFERLSMPRSSIISSSSRKTPSGREMLIRWTGWRMDSEAVTLQYYENIFW